jgi:hypothetical protein
MEELKVAYVVRLDGKGGIEYIPANEKEEVK